VGEKEVGEGDDEGKMRIRKESEESEIVEWKVTSRSRENRRSEQAESVVRWGGVSCQWAV
jgi:hypothetical protein